MGLSDESSSSFAAACNSGREIEAASLWLYGTKIDITLASSLSVR